jgi:hypothetical protein
LKRSREDGDRDGPNGITESHVDDFASKPKVPKLELNLEIENRKFKEPPTESEADGTNRWPVFMLAKVEDILTSFNRTLTQLQTSSSDDLFFRISGTKIH